MPSSSHSTMQPRSWHSVAAYTIFMIYGLVYLGSWNTWITANGFFKSRFTGSIFADTFMSYFAICYMVVMFACLTLFLAKPNAIALNARVIIGHTLIILIFSAAAIMALLSLDPYVYFFLTLCLIVLSSVATSFQAAAYGILPLYPPIYSSAFMSGQGLAGLIPSLVQLALTASSVNAGTDSYRAFAYFFLTIFLATGVMIGYQKLLPNLPVKRSIEYQQANTEDHEDDDVASDIDIIDEGDIVNPSTSSIGVGKDKLYWPVFQKVYLLGGSLWLGFVITLASFPAITSAVESTSSNTLLVPIHFVIFNLFDLLGKTLPGCPSLFIKSPTILFILSVARLVFPPAFLLCNVTFHDRFGNILGRTLPLVFGKDWMFLGITAAFALSNGYVDAACIMAAPLLIPDGPRREDGDDEEDDGRPTARIQREGAGAFMVACISCGLLVGSMSSFLLRYLLCNCNPFYS
ncbi:hypothetical protein SmJEL517_g01602 [Synchytrium microbalum]|uniref:Nucleoside transporter n=1 Tax=Synchytrium microbalum TaxID=1806994 RepID=A0A507CF22_9FUNG|nr:uncharacterized protein SmJEL517_g01602 [Synchytrium microbalum]TPX36185.1 hypothetical protein SmJEL517_g01602 [Synchytrium microbalum]